MWIPNKIAFATVALSLMVINADGDGLSGAMNPQAGGGIGGFDGAIAYPLKASAAGGGCHGKMDLSAGCAFLVAGYGGLF